MSDTLLIALIGGIQAIAIVVIPLWFKYSNDRNREHDQEERREVAEKVADNKHTLEQVHTAVNSTATQMSKDLKAARKEITRLTVALEDKQPKPGRRRAK